MTEDIHRNRNRRSSVNVSDSVCWRRLYQLKEEVTEVWMR